MIFLLNIITDYHTKQSRLTTEEEKRLLERVRRGDTAAFEKIYRLYVKELCSFAAYYVKSFDAAEDIVQNLFLLLWERRETIRIEGFLKTYLFTSVRNLSLNFLKHQTIDRNSSDAYSKLFSLPSATPHEIAEHQELDVLITQALEKIPERCRIVFILSRYFNMKYTEIAEILEISMKTVDAQMVKAIKILRSDLRFE
ncbi:MAG: RNA polymerase sigma-70 factor [Ignavibacteriales bacterium]|nr:RNA polymerase sigma-70 factor [Ignavibacteriales bacterium]